MMNPNTKWSYPTLMNHKAEPIEPQKLGLLAKVPRLGRGAFDKL